MDLIIQAWQTIVNAFVNHPGAVFCGIILAFIIDAALMGFRRVTPRISTKKINWSFSEQELTAKRAYWDKLNKERNSPEGAD